MKLIGDKLYEEVYNSKTEKYELVDVTNKAFQFLSAKTKLENVTVRDVYSLIAKNPIIQEILHHNFVKEFIAHISLNKPKLKVEDKDPETEIEYIEIYRGAEFIEALNRIDFAPIPHMHGMSQILTREYEGFPIGQRIPWSVSFRPVEDLLDKKIVINSIVRAQNGGGIDHIVIKKHLTFDCPGYTLLDILNAITYELSFYGTPDDAQEVGDSVKDMGEQLKDAIDNGTIDELLEAQNDDDEDEENAILEIESLLGRTAYVSGFTHIDNSINRKELEHMIAFIPNRVDISIFFYQLFGEKLILKSELIGLTAYEYRHKMRNYSDEYLPSMEMINIIAKKEGLRGSTPTYIDDLLFEYLTDMGVTVTEDEIRGMETF